MLLAARADRPVSMALSGQRTRAIGLLRPGRRVGFTVTISPAPAQEPAEPG